MPGKSREDGICEKQKGGKYGPRFFHVSTVRGNVWRGCIPRLQGYTLKTHISDGKSGDLYIKYKSVMPCWKTRSALSLQQQRHGISASLGLHLFSFLLSLSLSFSLFFFCSVVSNSFISLLLLLFAFRVDALLFYKTAGWLQRDREKLAWLEIYL